MFTNHNDIPEYLKKISSVELAYLAGFLDGDGSLFIRIIKAQDVILKFKILIGLAFYQPKKNIFILEHIKSTFNNYGTLIIRKDGSNICNYVISDSKKIKDILTILYPYLKIKKPTAKLVLEIIKDLKELKEIMYTKESCDSQLPIIQATFIKVCEKIDKVAELNYSKNRKITSQTVKEYYKFYNIYKIQSPVETQNKNKNSG